MDAISSTLSAAGATSPEQILHLLVFVVLGVLLAPAAQATIEHNLAEKSWMPKGLKPWLPTLISAVLGFASTKLGVDPQAAMALVASLSAATHTVNATELAAIAPPAPAREQAAAAAGAPQASPSGTWKDRANAPH